ncbi:MAG: FecR domain-containing protein [Verrucomicrobiae bacterium]|nr:FecR domain-containing protein [Verrucomicrobiae bacterium]
MKDGISQEELLVRFLDGSLSPSEEAELMQLLEQDSSARESLREMSEQVIAVADLERTSVAVRAETARQPQREPNVDEHAFMRGFLRVSFKFVLPLAALVTLTTVVLQEIISKEPATFLKISKVSSASHLHTALGKIEDQLEVNMPVREGDTVESRSCDSWLVLQLGDKSHITLAGHSYLQNLEKEGNSVQLRFLTGSLWADFSPEKGMQSFTIQTPTCSIELKNAQFDLHTERFFTRLRVNDGTAVVTRLLDQSRSEVRSGEQIECNIDDAAVFESNEQPLPVDHWQCQLLKGPDISLGTVLPSFENDFANIKAEPLPWKIRHDKHIMLYAVALSVSRSSDQPVLLQSGSTLRYYLSYDEPDRVRFGFSTQRIGGVYAGKFETDVEPSQLGPAGDILEIELDLDAFWPLSPQLSPGPEGLEVSDIYALTIKRDAGLKVHRIEIIPPNNSSSNLD